MVYPQISDMNLSTGYSNLFVYANTVTEGWFAPLILFAILMITTLATYFSQKRLMGDGDFPVCFAAGSFVTFTIALVLALGGDGIISNLTIGIYLLVLILGIVFMFISRKDV